MQTLSTTDDILTSFKDIKKSLGLLGLHIHDELQAYPVWIDEGDGQLISERDRVIYALTHFTPTEGLSPQETLACVGAVGCTEVTLRLIDNVNQAKDKFKSLVDNYLTWTSTNQRDTAIIRHILARHGHPGIKLKQVYRHIKYIRFHPRRLSFTQAEHSSNRTINKQTAEKLLQEAGEGKHIDVQRAKINLIGQQDKLIIRRTIHNCWLSNIATFKDENGRSSFSKVWTSLPLFYLHDKHLPLPQVGFSKKYEKHKQGPRADKKSENKPFIPSIHAYRCK